MLQVIRDRAQGFFAWLIIGAIILSFALWGINEYFRDDSAGMQAATVNGVDVSLYQYQIAYNNERNRMQQMFGENFDADMFDDQIKNSALDRVVDNTVITQTALNAGMAVSDAQLFSTLQSIEAFQENGKFSKSAYEMALRQSGEPSSSFETRIRRALLSDQIIKGIAATGFATTKDVEANYRLQNQKRDLSYVRLAAADFKNDIKISDDEIKSKYEADRESYKTQEQVNLEYVELNVKDLMKSVEVSDDELEEAYDEQKDRFTTKEERKARHILIEGKGEESKAKAQSIYEKLKAGADFAEMAKKNSDDPGSAAQGGLLEFFGRGIMDPAFEEAAFSQKKGEIGKPVLSEFGYHIIKVEEIRGGKVKPLSEVKDALMADVKRQKAEKIYFDKVEKLANLSYETPDTLGPVAEQLELDIKTTGFFGRAGGPGIASDRKVSQAAFSEDVLRERLNSELLELGDNHAVVVRVKDYHPAEIRPMEQVRGRIESELKNEKAKTLAKQKGESLVKQIEAGKSLEDVAKANKLKATASKEYERNDSTLGPEISRKAFAIKHPAEGKPSVKGFSLNNGDYVVVSLSKVIEGDASKMSDAEKKGIENNIANASGGDEFGFMLNAIKDRSEIKKFPGNL